MANLYSDLLTNVVTNPYEKNPSSKYGGRVRRITARYVMTGSEQSNDVLHICQLPSNAALLSVTNFRDDPGTALTVDFGIYDSDKVAVDDDLYASAVDMSGADTGGTNLLFEASGRGIEDRGNQLWQDLALAKDPSVMYHLSLTMDTVTTPTAAADLVFEITYTVD